MMRSGKPGGLRRLSQAKRVLVVVTLALGATMPAFAQAQPYAIPKTEVRTLPRSANGRDYVLYVAFPLSYETAGAGRRYPVVYMCDGYWDFPLGAYAADYVRRDGMAPETLVVGIGYGGTDPDVGLLRQWDLTPGNDPVYDAAGRTTGHAAEFLGVVANEIIPYVESTYRADPSFRMLFGSSFGGLFAMYAAFERPELFQGVVVSGASLDWRDDLVLGMARAHKAAGRALNTRLYVGWGDGDTADAVRACRTFAEEAYRLAIPGSRIAAREIVGAGHSGSKPENFTRGMRFVFSPQAWVPVVGMDPGYGELGRFVNLSTRGQVGAGDEVLIGGVVVQGVLPKRILVRAAGPGLSGLGVEAPLANPRLRVVDSSGRLVAQNDDWSAQADPATVERLAKQVGAFAFAAGSADAATVVRLEPGAYTVVVESADGSSGVALVEAYEVGP